MHLLHILARIRSPNFHALNWEPLCNLPQSTQDCLLGFRHSLETGQGKHPSLLAFGVSKIERVIHRPHDARPGLDYPRRSLASLDHFRESRACLWTLKWCYVSNCTRQRPRFGFISKMRRTSTTWHLWSARQLFSQLIRDNLEMSYLCKVKWINYTY